MSGIKARIVPEISLSYLFLSENRYLQGITRHACLTSYQMIKLSGALTYKRKIQPSDFVPRHIM